MSGGEWRCGHSPQGAKHGSMCDLSKALFMSWLPFRSIVSSRKDCLAIHVLHTCACGAKSPACHRNPASSSTLTEILLIILSVQHVS
jgi:hypothetical protein